MRGRVLVIDDEGSMCELLEAGLQKGGFLVVSRTSATEALRVLGAEEFDAVVTDLNLPAIERAVALTSYECLAVEDFPERIQDYQPSEFLAVSGDPTAMPPLAEIERRYILHIVEAVGANKALAARILGLDRKTLYRKLEKYAGGGQGARSEEP